MSSPQLHTARFTLLPVTANDLDNIYRGLSHPDVVRHYGVRYNSPEETKEQMDWYAGLERYGTGFWWTIRFTDSGVFCGAGGFNHVRRIHRKAEAGFWLLPEFWGMGIMGEVFPVLCNHAFKEMKLHRIEGYVESENTPSKRTLERLNFRHEGTMVDCEWKDGRFISLEIYALLEDGT